jgi:hypothetical protein
MRAVRPIRAVFALLAGITELPSFRERWPRRQMLVRLPSCPASSLRSDPVLVAFLAVRRTPARICSAVSRSTGRKVIFVSFRPRLSWQFLSVTDRPSRYLTLCERLFRSPRYMWMRQSIKIYSCSLLLSDGNAKRALYYLRNNLGSKSITIYFCGGLLTASTRVRTSPQFTSSIRLK